MPSDDALQDVHQQLKETVLQKDYPCVAALRAIEREDYVVGLYGALGRSRRWRELRQDLLAFLAEQGRSGSPYRTMFAIFPESGPLTEGAFETAMWAELSGLTSEETRSTDWAEGSVSEANDQAFVFSLGGQALFVVGVHPASSRRGRRFPFTGLIFNAFSQFEVFEQRGTYERMVAINRARDIAFDGSVNPMVERHGNQWEAIQFSGQKNPDDWKCPFRFMRDAEKK